LRIEVGRDAAADLAEAMAESPSGSLWGRYRKGVVWIEGALPGGIDSPAASRGDGWNRVGIWVRSRTLEPPPNIRERFEKWFPENWHVVLMAASARDGTWLFRDADGSLGPHSHFQPGDTPPSRPQPRGRLSWVLSSLAGAAGLAGLAAMPVEHRPALRIEPAGGQQVRVVWNQRAINAAGAQLEIREGARRRALVIGPLDQGVTWERAGPAMEVELRRGDLVEIARAPALP
jgi:hypothetical protein